MFAYSAGQVVRHARYEYRGVIVAADPVCQAEEGWYRRNRTQPSRNQPWYHVLVDGGRETYVAEENMVPDDSGERIDHPMVERFFAAFHDGRYFLASRN